MTLSQSQRDNEIKQQLPEYEALLASMQSPTAPSYFAGMYYGEIGTGKTVTAVATIKKINESRNIHKGILIIETGSGADSLLNHPDLYPLVRRIKYESYEQIMAIGAMIRGKVGEFANFNAIILDEVSSMVNDENIRVHAARQKLGMMQTSEKNAGADQPGAPPSWPTYFAVASRSREMIMNLIKIPELHLILTSHQKNITTKDGANIVQIAPNITPASFNAFSQEMHVIARFEATAKKLNGIDGPLTYVREVQVQSTNFYVTKSRMNLPVDKLNAEWLPDGVTQWLNQNQNLTGINPAVEPPPNIAEDILPNVEAPEMDEVPQESIDLDTLLNSLS